MSEEQPEKRKSAQVVYSRSRQGDEGASPEAGGAAAPSSAQKRKIAPTLLPLLVGFALLLALVLILGTLSVNRLNDVSLKVLDLERHYAANLSLLLRLRVAVTKLNNEARARAEAEAENRILPPLALRLNNARREVSELVPLIERSTLAQDERGRAFSRNLAAFLEVTEDLDRYSLEGYERFRLVDTTLDEILSRANSEQEAILAESEQLQSAAAGRIRLLTLLAVLAGLVVAAVTTWLIQRSFQETRRSLEEAERERQFSTQLLEGMVSAVAAMDSGDVLRSANQAFFRLFPKARIGVSVHEKFAPDEAMRMLEAATASRVERAVYRGRFPLGVEGAQANGAPRFFDVYSSPLQIDGERGIVVTLVDVTEAAQAEAELRNKEALVAVGEATAQVAHEIRNPLGSIKLGVALLREQTKDPEASRTIDRVERGIDHLSKLTVDVTEFSKQKPLSLAEADLHELIDNSLELVTDRINEKKIVVQKQFTPEPLRGEMDADQLRQVFVNLFANALDASEDGKQLTITTNKVAGSDGSQDGTRRARITIADQGSGIDEAMLSQVFEPFFTTKKRGTGLGLPIVKKIIEQHGGHVSVTSKPGQGTSFTVELPLPS